MPPRQVCIWRVPMAITVGDPGDSSSYIHRSRATLIHIGLLRRVTPQVPGSKLMGMGLLTHSMALARLPTLFGGLS
jgi:hypothetical protein